MTAAIKKEEKICEWFNCKIVFIPRTKCTKFCPNKHFKNCENCGSEFEVLTMKRPAKCCSIKCSGLVSAVTTKENPDNSATKYIKNCDFCGDKFEAVKYNAKYCSKNHMAICEGCNKEFVITCFRRPAKTCSKKCASLLIDFEERNKKLSSTVLEKYGVENISQLDSIKEMKRSSTLKNYGVENIFQLPEVQIKASESVQARVSQTNKKWQEMLKKETGIAFDSEVLIGENYLADLGHKNILLEINPSITHSSTMSFPHLIKKCTLEDCKKRTHLPKENTYHQKRALLAEKNNKILLQYFDWYDQNIFLDILKSKLALCENIVYARSTELREIPQRDANFFFKENHLMGASNSQTLCLGLFYNNVLIHCQSYGPPRFNKQVEWEAIRSCTKLNYHIPGAFSKCDKYFFEREKPKSVVSYVDLSISNGKTDLKFDGWKLESINAPSATWVKVKNLKSQSPLYIRDSTARRISADRLLGFEVGDKYPRFNELGEKITNEYVLLSEGYIKVFDAGTKTFIWNS